VRVEATLRNDGTGNATYVAGLHAIRRLDATTVGTRAVSVPAGANRSVSFVTAFAEPGNYSLLVNGTVAGNVTVEGTSAVAVTGTTVNRTAVGVNESVRVDVTLENTGTGSGTYVAGVQTFHRGNWTFVGKRSVTVPAGERRNVSFVTAFRQAGNHTVSVNGTQGGPVTVESGGGGGLLSSIPFLSVFSFLGFLPLDLIGMAVGGLVGLYVVLVLVTFVLRRIGGGGESAGG